MKKIFQNSSSALLDFFFPPECVGCGQEDFWICQTCVQKIRPEILRLSGKRKNLKYVWALTDYHNRIIERSVQKLKFGYCHEIINNLHPFLRLALKQISFPKDPLFCPVPLHFFRKNTRGFNQAEVLANSFSEITDIPVHQLLRRRRNTKPQTLLKGKERFQNLKDVFSIIPRKMQGLEKNTPIILVDDVTTTFSTLDECAEVLKKNGFSHVYGIVMARSIMKS